MLNWTKFNDFCAKTRNKKVLILGLGLQGGGVGASKFFHQLHAKIRITDLKTEDKLQESLKKIENLNIDRLTLGRHLQEDVDFADLILVNPDVPQNAPILEYAKATKKKIFMEEALFVELSPVNDVLGVTGTRGKTTTTTLIGELLKTEFPVYVAGNVAGSETLMLLFQIKDEATKVVLELSSFQLRGFHYGRLSPHVAVVTNVYEDHLNKYRNMEEYINDKRAIYLYQNVQDFFVCNERFKDKFMVKKTGQTIYFKSADVAGFTKFLKGEHNDENYAAGLQVANIFKIPTEKSNRVFADFSGVPFRQQFVGKIKEVTFINDTTATTPQASIVALEAFKGRSLVLICGGNNKKCQDDEFARQAVLNSAKIIFLKGDATLSFRQKVLQQCVRENKNIAGEIYDDFFEAVKEAFFSAKPGGVVLLSPGFTSFGMFENEFDRGRQFNTIVNKLNAEYG